MKLTVAQTMSFLKDDNTIADTTGIELIESDIDPQHDEAVFTLVVKVNDKFYKGEVRYYDGKGSFSEGDYIYGATFFDDFKGLEMKEVVLTEKVIKVWTEV